MVAPLAASSTAASNVGYPVSPIHATEGAAGGAAAGSAAGVGAGAGVGVGAGVGAGVAVPSSEDMVVPSSANATVGSNPASIVQHSRTLSSIESLLLVLIKMPPNYLIGGYRKPPQSAKN